MQESVEYVKWYLNSEHNTSFEDMIAERAEKTAKKAAIEAEQNSLIKTAKNLLSLNIDINKISLATGLSKHEIDKLKKEQ